MMLFVPVSFDIKNGLNSVWRFYRANLCGGSAEPLFASLFLFFEGGADIYEVSMVKTSCSKAGHTLADYQVLIIWDLSNTPDVCSNDSKVAIPQIQDLTNTLKTNQI